MSMVCSLSGKKTIIEFIEEKDLHSVLEKSLTVTDQQLYELYQDIPEPLCILPPGETAKHLGSVQLIIDSLLEKESSRDSSLAAFGGGVICDIVSFCSSIYMRGMNVVFIPTTLLAMVDASVGGKTGIDYRGCKNLLGTFYPASRVLLYPEVLRTLPEKEYLNGLAEVIKHALLAGGELYNMVSQRQEEIISRDAALLKELIAASLQVKIDIVEQDPEELFGIRQQLNFGHTFAHALESSTEFSLSHGEAVAWGMAKALQAGVQVGITKPDYADHGISLLRAYGYPVEIRVDRKDEFLRLLKHDKKRRGDVVPFILQKKLGETILFPLELPLVESLLDS